MSANPSTTFGGLWTAAPWADAQTAPAPIVVPMVDPPVLCSRHGLPLRMIGGVRDADAVFGCPACARGTAGAYGPRLLDVSRCPECPEHARPATNCAALCRLRGRHAWDR
jgi:hypothetical protein